MTVLICGTTEETLPIFRDSSANVCG